MVNYCCVEGCFRNSRNSRSLNFYCIPKDLFRREQWLKAAGREDLMNKVQIGYTRFCSRHFPPAQTKRKTLGPDAVPCLNLPGSINNDPSQEHEPLKHAGVICNGCSEPVFGFRYKCIACQDYDLCQKCEMNEVHPQHLMLRISRPMKFMIADKLITKWHEMLKTEQDGSDYHSDNDSKDYEYSDDEPITKYAKDNDSGVDLPDNVKKKIRNEVAKFIKVFKNQKPEQTNAGDNVKKRASDVNRSSKRLRSDGPSNNKKADAEVIQELAFADVGDVKLDSVKNEPLCTIKDDKQGDIYMVIVENEIPEIMIKRPTHNENE